MALLYVHQDSKLKQLKLSLLVWHVFPLSTIAKISPDVSHVLVSNNNCKKQVSAFGFSFAGQTIQHKTFIYFSTETNTRLNETEFHDQQLLIESSESNMKYCNRVCWLKLRFQGSVLFETIN